jgi:signal transduction histidine kinase/CHASE3 domain sensor protein
MPSQRFTLGAGLAILLVITAASIGLDAKSRSDAAWVNHTLTVQKEIADLRSLVRGGESAVRGFALNGDPGLLNEFRETDTRIASAFASLAEATKDSPGQAQLIKETQSMVSQRLGISNDVLRLLAAGDSAGLAALRSRAEGRALMTKIVANLDVLAAEEEKLLATRSAQSHSTGQILLAIDLAGVAMILLIATLLVLEGSRASRALQESLATTRATNLSLEAEVAERTQHLVAAHEELRRSTAVMETTFHSMAEAVLVIDTKGEGVLSNPAAEKMLRYQPGMTVELLRSQNQAFQADGVTPIEIGEMPAARALRGEQFDNMEIISHPVGENATVHLVASGRPLHDAAGAISGAALVFHDITGTRETEHKLQQSQKLDAIGKLTGGVAHDFNNMLTVITGTTETLVAALKDQPSLQKTAELIDQAAERCRELIQHLLAFARRQPLQPRNVDINSTVLDITKLLRPTLGEQIEIEAILNRELIYAHIDPSQLANSLLNLAINARDAMPDGGKLLFETSKVVLDEAYATANPDVTSGEYVMLAVSDTGTGMSPEVRDKVFEPFFTTKEVGKGSGLGMSMVYGFVKQSGGHIKIYSEIGHGTSIKLYLPPARGQVQTPASVTAPVAGGSATILVVEDDTLVRNYVTVQLQSLGYKTITAIDSRTALTEIENGATFDLLFTDVILPGGLTGRQLADEVVKQRPGTKVLYTSGYTANAIVHHGRLDPGVLLLAKPYRKAQLAEMIEKALKVGAA